MTCQTQGEPLRKVPIMVERGVTEESAWSILAAELQLQTCRGAAPRLHSVCELENHKASVFSIIVTVVRIPGLSAQDHATFFDLTFLSHSDPAPCCTSAQ
eukprot:2766785-Amphidinium_carterae.2